MKTYTDDEIVRALECCSQCDSTCENCPVNGVCDDDSYCFTGAILDLIKRQQAEIEKLNIDLDAMRCAANSLKMHYDKAKSEAVWDIATEYDAYKETVEVALVETRAEAIKEFAERLKKRLDRKYTIYGREYVLRHLRELVKEMEEEK